MADYVSEYRTAFAVPTEPEVLVVADIAPYLEALDKAIAQIAFTLHGGNVHEIRTIEEFYGVTFE